MTAPGQTRVFASPQKWSKSSTTPPPKSSSPARKPPLSGRPLTAGWRNCSGRRRDRVLFRSSSHADRSVRRDHLRKPPSIPGRVDRRLPGRLLRNAALGGQKGSEEVKRILAVTGIGRLAYTGHPTAATVRIIRVCGAIDDAMEHISFDAEEAESGARSEVRVRRWRPRSCVLEPPTPPRPAATNTHLALRIPC